MSRSKILLAVALATVLAVPAATATWFVHGTYEPDTAKDATDGYMYAEPDVSASGKRVYFNAWSDLTGAGQNPNSGTAGSAIYTTPSTAFSAMLGVWKDCNKDGFVGMADGALWEYHAALLPSRDVCNATGDNESHIRGDWVYEFRWIGPFDVAGRPGTDASAEAWMVNFGARSAINDTAARVWHDWGLPGQKPGSSCTISPLPAGMTASTGGLLDYADCFVNKRVKNTVNGADGDGSLGLRMDGEPQRSDSHLNQQIPFHPWYDPYHPESVGAYERDRDDGNPNDDDAAFQVWDCSQQETVHVADDTPVADPTGQVPDDVVVGGATLVRDIKDDEGNLLVINEINVNYSGPSPQVFRADGSYYEGVNNTWDGVADHCYDEAGWTWTSAEGAAGDVDADEKPRNEHDTAFRFYAGQSPAINWGAAGGCTGRDAAGNPFPPGCGESPADSTQLPDDFGVQAWRTAGRTVLNLGGVGWHAMKGWTTSPQLINRNTLQPSGAAYATFYASVGQATLLTAQVPGSGVYGAEWCNGATTGSANGFDCDASNWWDPIAHPGTTAMPVVTGAFITGTCTTGRTTPLSNCREMGVKPGQVYQLRDIDCYDGQLVRGVPVYASLVELASGPCLRPT